MAEAPTLMTKSELKGIVEFRYMRESARLKQPTFKVTAGEFILYYEATMAEIFSALSIGEATQDIAITPVTVYTEYDLDAAYGGLRNFEIVFTGEEAGLARLELTPIEEMPTVGDNLTSGTPNRIAIFPSDDSLYHVYLYPLSGFTGTLRIRYKLLSGLSPSLGSASSLNGEVYIPSQYQNLLIMGILSQLLPEFESKYRFLLDEALLYNATPSKGNIEYNLGGF